MVDLGSDGRIGGSGNAADVLRRFEGFDEYDQAIIQDYDNSGRLTHTITHDPIFETDGQTVASFREIETSYSYDLVENRVTATAQDITTETPTDYYVQEIDMGADQFLGGIGDSADTLVMFRGFDEVGNEVERTYEYNEDGSFRVIQHNLTIGDVQIHNYDANGLLTSIFPPESVDDLYVGAQNFYDWPGNLTRTIL